MADLRYKQENFNEEEHRTIFDLDNELSPVGNPLRLLHFEVKAAERKKSNES